VTKDKLLEELEAQLADEEVRVNAVEEERDELIRRVPKAKARAHFNLGYALSKGGDKAGAEAAFRAAIAADPQHATAHSNLGILLGWDRGDWAGAEAAFRAAIAADPQYASAHSNLGAVLHNRGRRGRAEAAYRAAIAADPQHADAHSNLGILLEQRGDKAGAEAAYRAAIAADPQDADTKAHWKRALRRLKKERREALQ
jgi:Flp pilus assembly protein TadD